VSFRVKSFRIPLAIIPLRCFYEVVEGFLDIASLFLPLSKKLFRIATTINMLVEEVQDYGSLDFIDVDVTNKDERIKIKLLLR